MFENSVRLWDFKNLGRFLFWLVSEFMEDCGFWVFSKFVFMLLYWLKFVSVNLRVFSSFYGMILFDYRIRNLRVSFIYRSMKVFFFFRFEVELVCGIVSDDVVDV